jgi:TRAP-type mannitol/chloroaromatic compound transport system permease small subunit
MERPPLGPGSVGSRRARRRFPADRRKAEPLKNSLQRFLRTADAVSLFFGKAISLAVFVMILIIAYDVLLRYAFRAPTIWQYDISYMLGGSVILLGAGYVHMKRRHVRVDIIYNRFSPRVRLFFDVLFTLVFFFPLVAGLLWVAADYAVEAYEIREFSEVGFWRPLMWPFRTVMALGLAVLLIQGAANFIRDLFLLVRGEEP